MVAGQVVVALCGLPGSGKSTLAAALAEVTGWHHIDRDRLRAGLPMLGYRDADKRLLGEMMQTQLLRALFARQNVILDGMTLARAKDRDAFAALTERAEGRWLLAWLDCSPALARKRVAGDVTHPAADRGVELVDAVLRRFEPPMDALRLDAGKPVSELLNVLVEYVTPRDE